MNYVNICKITQQIAIKAGIAILDIYNSDIPGNVIEKNDKSPLTKADISSNDIICGELERYFPEIPILSEETSSTQNFIGSKCCWIVDPLDGTKEFINKNGEFTVNIALVKDHKPVIGVVYIPVQETLFFASKGDGAYKIINGKKKRINVTNKIDNLIFVGSKSHRSELEDELIKNNNDKIFKIISVGSSLKGTMIAEGKADIYYRYGLTCEWDTCAMQCIVEEAGGFVGQMDGLPLDYNREDHLNRKGFYMVNCKENIWI